MEINCKIVHKSPELIKDYFDVTVKYIDKTFGDGYAKAHPQLLGMLVHAAAIDNVGDTLSDNNLSLVYAIEIFGKNLCESIEGLGIVIDSLSDLIK